MEKVLDYIRKNGMVQRGDRIIAGVSGGPDSVCLLFLLDKYKETLGISLEVVHMEHGIRGKESLEDAAFVENFCRKLAIPCHTYHRDIPKLAREWKCSGEEAGRRARYEAFEEVRSKNGGTKIAVRFPARQPFRCFPGLPGQIILGQSQPFRCFGQMLAGSRI